LLIVIIRRPRINNQIFALELRVIDDAGKNLGVLSKEEAVAMAREKGLDLIEIAPTAQPPVVKIMELGKFLYQEQKKAREGRKGQKSETKQVRFSIRTSSGDFQFKAKQVDKFLQKRYKVRILLALKGREKSLRDFANERLHNFMSLITESYKVEQPSKNTPMGIMMIIAKP